MVTDKRVDLLRIEETELGVFEWKVVKKLWAHTEAQNKANIFSKVGIGARSVLFTLAPAAGITLHDALRLGDRHYFITAINRVSPVRMEIPTAETDPVVCSAKIIHSSVGENKRASYSPEKTLLFPAILTEKYLGFSQETPMAEIDMTFVLVTPKAIELEMGDIVRIQETAYAVQVCHMLDEYKNEYEVYRRGDV